jgi:cytochrome c-type biogenesis protein CcmH
VAAVGAAVAGAIALYAEIGVPGYPDIPLAARLAEADARLAGRPSQAEAVAAAPAPQASPAADPEFLALMEKLRAAVASRPDDLRGLELLARNEAGLGNLPAAEAAQRALIVARGASATAEDHAGLAEIMIRAAGGFVSPEAEAELTRALTLDPRNGAARYYAGLMFAQAGRYDRAFALWRPLYEESPPEAPWMAGLAAELPGLAQLAGVAWTPPEARTPGPDAAAIAAAEGMSPEERQAMIEGMVAQLSDRLATEGGSTEDWARLIRALGVLERREQAQAIYDEAKQRFAGRDADLSFLGEAALEAGLTP